jgi:L-ascorbate metabolism protein UlaG (beta-lactamase superfamily)
MEDDKPKEHFSFIRASTILIEICGKRILTDPWFKNHLRGLPAFIKPAIRTDDLPSVDIILVSHLHPDHYDLSAVKKICNRNLTIIGPRGIKKKSESVSGKEIIELEPSEKSMRYGILFHAFKAKHTYPAPDEIVFIIAGNGYTIFFGGDAAYSEVYREIGDLYSVDLSFVPVGGTRILSKKTVMDEKDAIRACRELRTKYAVPIHEGGTWMSLPPLSLHPGRARNFQQLAEKENFKIILPEPGLNINFPLD